MFSIARLGFDGKIDSTIIELPSQNTAIASSLAGGVRGTIYNLHLLPDGKVLAVGISGTT